MLGAILLLKQSADESQSKIIALLEQSVAVTSLRDQLKESMDLNKKMVEEMDGIVKRKLAEEEEIYTKFRILLNRKD